MDAVQKQTLKSPTRVWFGPNEVAKWNKDKELGNWDEEVFSDLHSMHCWMELCAFVKLPQPVA